MNNIKCFLFLWLTFSTVCFAKEKYFTAEYNCSWFANTESQPLSGFGLGYGWRWHPKKLVDFNFGFHAFYCGSRVNDKKITSYTDMLFMVDADWRIGYIEFPFVWDIHFSSQKSLDALTTVGLSFYMPVFDGGKTVIQEKLHYAYPYPKSDYAFGMDWPLQVFENFRLDLLLGLGMAKANHRWRCLVRYDMTNSLQSLDGITRIDHKFLTFSIVYCYSF